MKVSLTTDEKLFYYRMPVLVAIVFVVVSAVNYETVMVPLLKGNITNDFKLLLGLLAIGVMGFFYKKNRLTYKKLPTALSWAEVVETLTQLIAKEDWELYKETANELVLIHTSKAVGDTRFFSRSKGERIYIIKNEEGIGYRSLLDLQETNFVTIPLGENLVNERTIANEIAAG